MFSSIRGPVPGRTVAENLEHLAHNLELLVAADVRLDSFKFFVRKHIDPQVCLWV